MSSISTTVFNTFDTEIKLFIIYYYFLSSQPQDRNYLGRIWCLKCFLSYLWILRSFRVILSPRWGIRHHSDLQPLMNRLGNMSQNDHPSLVSWPEEETNLIAIPRKTCTVEQLKMLYRIQIQWNLINAVTNGPWKFGPINGVGSNFMTGPNWVKS